MGLRGAGHIVRGLREDARDAARKATAFCHFMQPQNQSMTEYFLSPTSANRRPDVPDEKVFAKTVFQ